MSDAHPPPAEWSALLRDAVQKPGVIAKAYSLFWNYSIGNQLLALFECAVRGIEPGPIHTFRGWQQVHRNVRKGEKAITLCMPVTMRRKRESDSKAPLDVAALSANTADRDDPKATFTKFLYTPRWFVLSQTEGEPFQPPELPDWNEALALSGLKIERYSDEPWTRTPLSQSGLPSLPGTTL